MLLSLVEEKGLSEAKLLFQDETSKNSFEGRLLKVDEIYITVNVLELLDSNSHFVYHFIGRTVASNYIKVYINDCLIMTLGIDEEKFLEMSEVYLASLIHNNLYISGLCDEEILANIDTVSLSYSLENSGSSSFPPSILDSSQIKEKSLNSSVLSSTVKSTKVSDGFNPIFIKRNYSTSKSNKLSKVTEDNNMFKDIELYFKSSNFLVNEDTQKSL